MAGCGGYMDAAGMFFSMREPPRVKPKEGFFKVEVLGLRAHVLNAVTISAVTFFAFWFYQPVTQRAGLGLAYLGWIGAGFNLFSAVLFTRVGLLEKAVGVRRLLLFSALLPGVFFIALGFVRLLALAIPALFLLARCKMVRTTALNAFINRHIESESRATVISSVSLLEGSVTFLLHPLVGLLADASLDYALWLLGGVCLVFAASTRISDRHLKNDASPDYD